MDIHKPKAAHSWREFLIEIGTIICGILIALGLEQGIEWIHHDRELRETREAIRKEILKNASAADATAREDRCLVGVGQRVLDWTRGRGPGVAGGPVISPYFVTTVWDASQAGPVSRMSLEEKFAFAEFYDTVRNMQSLVVTERAQDAEIAHTFALRNPTEAEKRVLAGAITAIQATLSAKVWNARTLVEQAANLGEHPKSASAWQQAVINRECQAAKITPPDFSKPLSPPGPPGLPADLLKSD